MLETDRDAVRERAYFIWLREGCPEGRAQDHRRSATLEEFSQRSDQDVEFIDEEKVSRRPSRREYSSDAD